MNDYEQRKQDRIDRYLEKAGKARAESSALSQQAHTMLSAIPPGQPMLPDHYSYKSDKRYRDRIDTKMRQSISADEKADYYEGKARAAANNRAISSGCCAKVARKAGSARKVTGKNENDQRILSQAPDLPRL